MYRLPGQTGQAGKTKLTFKLDFLCILCRAAFTILAMFANLSMFYISIRQEEIQEGQDLWEETISCFLSLSGDLGIGLV